MTLDALRSWLNEDGHGAGSREFGIAIALVAIGTLINLLAWPSGWPIGSDEDGHYFFLVVAVLVSALYGGLLPGLLATTLAGLSTSYFTLSPQFSIRIADPAAARQLAVFLMEGVMLSLVAHLIRKHHKAEVTRMGWNRFLAIPLTVGAATVAKLVSPDLAQERPFALNYAAVCVCSWVGGTLPGIIAIGLLAVLTKCLFLGSLFSVPDRGEAIRIILFAAEGLLLVFLGSSYAKLKLLAARASMRARAYMAGALSREQDSAAILAISRDTIWEWGLDTGEITRTPSWEDALSIALPAREDFTSWVERMHPADRAATVEKLHYAIELGRQELQYTYRLRGPRGEFLSVWDHVFIVRGSDWEPLRVIGRSADLSSTPLSNMAADNRR